jgi:hypothetical protein
MNFRLFLNKKVTKKYISHLYKGGRYVYNEDNGKDQREVLDMAEWKDIYLSLMRNTEQAIRILEEGQKKCEEMYLEAEGLNYDPDEDCPANSVERKSHLDDDE